MPKNPGKPWTEDDLKTIWDYYLGEPHPYTQAKLKVVAAKMSSSRSWSQVSWIVSWLKPRATENMPTKARNKVRRQIDAMREDYEALGLIPDGK